MFTFQVSHCGEETMLAHRFRQLLSEESATLVSSRVQSASTAFVPCPTFVVQSMSAAQQTQADQLYRLAYEQAVNQLGLGRKSRGVEFSRN
jgi:hypothetical protein